MGDKNAIFFAISVVLATLYTTTHGQDILGCGGFVKSEVEINFSLVEVKLYTRQGSLKYQTDCAPHNGYYMVPVYDKGEYTLKVEPPAGWTFSPESVDLTIDGSSDKCSLGQDINFQFTGFGVVGKVVSSGQSSGPAGVSVSLQKIDSIELLQTMQTQDGGDFTFENVLPGEYNVVASHPLWHLGVSSVPVKVDKETGQAGSELTVRGYDVTGRVFSEGEPINGVSFILFSDTVSKADVIGCDTSEVTGFSNSLTSSVCHVTSQKDGRFTFPGLPYGEYKVVPFYKGDNIFFDVVPAELSFSVGHNSVNLAKPFDVAGFSVQGKVLNSLNGRGVAGAHIVLNGKEEAVSGEDGTYHLDSMKAGDYRIQVTAKHMTFNVVKVKVTPNTPHLPDMIAAKFSLCGQIIIDKAPEVLGQVSRQRSLTVASHIGSLTTITSDSKGSFCTDVAPGTYTLEVVLSEAEKKAGLKLAPTSKDVVITDSPVTGVVFSQFRAQVSGTVSCLETCGVVQLSLTSLSRSGERKSTQANEVSKDAAFVFDDVMPGKYKISLHQEEWCWKEKSIEVEVTDDNIKDLNFQQSGYVLSCSLSHPIKLSFEHSEKSGMVGEFDLPAGINKFCLAEPGVYSLKPQSCHQFEQETYSYDTSSPTVLTLTATKHLTTGVIVSGTRHGDITVSVKSSMPGDATVLGPLISDKEPLPPKDNSTASVEQPGPYTYEFSYWAKTNEKLAIQPSSQELLFYPPKITTTISGESCPGEIARFEGRQGVFITGSVSPGLAGVHIKIFTATDPGNVIVSIDTDVEGNYRVGPLHGDKEYGAGAEKDGYVLTPVAGQLGHFAAFKLGEIKVSVIDESGSSLAGVLLSLSGDTQYRPSNKVTQEDGNMQFASLSPGKYFLKPMMKEYTFQPKQQMVDVLEGSSIALQLTATRVAFSCYGSVTSLNGEAESGVIVEAVGRGPQTCSQLQEEGKSEPDGTFRIRGLKPECVYDVRIKAGSANQHIERTTPKTNTVQVTESDIRDLRIIAFRRISQMDISGNVVTTPEHLASLKVRLLLDHSDEDSLDAPSGKRELHSLSLASSPFFYLPAITIDNKNYVLRLESSLSKNEYQYALPEVVFSANSSFKHVTFKFEPKPKEVEQELKPTSFLIIPLAGLAMLLAYNYQAVISSLRQGSFGSSSSRAVRGDSPSHQAQPQYEYVDDVTVGGGDAQPKKKKVRKA